VTDLELPDDHRVFSFGLLDGVTLADDRMIVFQHPVINSRYRLTYGAALQESTNCHLKGV
jgi:hypothetical protein